jgi:hypothetical protein
MWQVKDVGLSPFTNPERFKELMVPEAVQNIKQ